MYAENAKMVKVVSLEGMQLQEHRATRGSFVVGKQKTIEKECDSIARRNKIVVVGLGNWCNSGCGISRRCSGPVKEIRQTAIERQALERHVQKRGRVQVVVYMQYTSCTRRVHAIQIAVHH